MYVLAVESAGVSLPPAPLPVIDPDSALEQCGDWGFVVELLEDVIKEKDLTVHLQTQHDQRADTHRHDRKRTTNQARKRNVARCVN